MSNDTTVRFKADISQLKSQMQAAERQIKLVNSEFKAATAGMDDWTKSADGLSAKTKQLSSVLEGQNKKLELMEKELEATVKAYGENSAAADRVRIKINEQKAAIAKTESQLQTYEKKLSDLSDTMDDAADGAEDYISASDKLKSTISEQEDKLESLKKRYSDLVLEGEGLSDEAENTAKEIKELSSELQENKTKLEDADKAADEFDDSLEEMDDASAKASDGFTVMKGALADLVADGIRATISAVKDLAKETFEVGSNFESAMSQVAAVSGVNADELQALTDKAEEMGAKTKFSATESAEAFNYMAMAGWKTEDMLDGIEGIMNLAAASGTDLATTSDIVTDALTAMGYEAKDAAHLADVMAAASSNANTNVEMMGLTFQYAAPLAGALGYNMEDTAAAIGLMANSGIKADKAGTALRGILSRLAAPPKECAAAMDDLGLSLVDDEGNMKSLAEVMRMLRRAFEGLSEEEQAQYAKHIAGQNAMSGLLAIVNASTEDYEKLTDAVYNSEGAAQKMADTMNDNVSGALTLMKSKIEGIMIKLFNRAKDSMRDGIDTFGKTLDKIDWNKVGDAIGDIAKKAADLFAYVVDNSDRIINIIKNVGTALAIIFVSNKIAAVTSAIGGFISALMRAKSATDALSSVTQLLGINMSALPIMLVVAGVAALYAYLKKTKKEIEENAQKTYGLTDAEQELIDKVNESTEAIERQKEARKETGQNIDLEADRIKALKDEYNSLIDENGKVKEGYEDFAAYLLDELATSLDTTVENIQENIDANGKLGDSIDDLIQKKKNEAKLAAYESEYTEALKNEVQYFKELKESKQAAKNAQDDLTKAQEEYNSAYKILNEYLEGAEQTGAIVPPSVIKQAEQAKENLAVAKNTYNELNNAVNQAAQNWGNAQSTIESYQDAMTASTEGNAEKMNDALLSMQYGLSNHTTATKKELEKQFVNTKTDLEDIQELYKNGNVSKEVVNDYKRVNELALEELNKWVAENEKGAADSADALNNGLKKGMPHVTATSSDIGVSSKLALFDGMGDWDKIGIERTEDFVDGMDSKKGEANKKGAEISNETSQGIKSQQGEFTIAGEDAVSAYTDEFNKTGGEVYNTGATAAGEAANGAKSQNGEFEAAGEDAANTYKNKINSYTNDYKKSGENAAHITANGTLAKLNEFKNAGDDSAKEYTNQIQANFDKYRAIGSSMAGEAASGADGNASAMQSPGNNAANEYINAIASNNSSANSAGAGLASEAASGADSHAGDAEGSGKNFAQGFINGIGSLVQEAFNKAYNLAKSAWQGLKKGQDEGSPSKLTTQSGVFFGEGYINGIKTMTKYAVIAAADMGLDAIKSLQDAQEEGSPSKLTYKSGKNFTQGYINGIASLETQLVNTSKKMVKTVTKELLKLNNFNFSDVADNASSAFSNAMTKKMEYTSGWMQYKNEKMLSDFDKTITALQKKSDKEVKVAQNASAKAQNSITKQSEKAQNKISKESAKTQKALQKEIDKIKDISTSQRTDAQKKQLKSLEKQLKNAQELEKKQLKAEQTSAQKKLKAEQSRLEKQTTAIQNTYQKQITTQQNMKNAYQRASSSFMSEFTKAMSEYQSAAQSLIDSTMESITTKYNDRYDALISKQNNLIDKLKNAGSLFSMDDANLMTTKDLKKQTEQITNYANKLKKIKGKVSEELFDQITSYDMEEGEAFVDRLLKMSSKELTAYNKAYTAKINAANKLAKDVYKKDFAQVEKDYNKEIKNAFKGLDKELNKIGQQCLKGFVSGLTSNTKYMDSSIKTFVNGMIATFKKQLGIKSPSKVTKKLGAYTAEGFADGISQNTDMVTKAIDGMVEAVDGGFDWSRLSLIDGFSDAVSDFETQAKEVLTNTISEIGTTYQSKFNDLLSKQENLAKKFKDSGDLFNISNAKVMTVNDLNAQIKDLEAYAAALNKIKGKVSSQLFDQITTYNAEEGQAFIERLLEMSDAELKAYSNAYDKKLSLSEQLSKSLYKSDLDKAASAYDAAIVKAFSSLPSILKTIGTQTMQGFLQGLGSDASYLEGDVKKIVNSLVNAFKKQLGIKSPSKVMEQIGEYTGEGFEIGLLGVIKSIKETADDISSTLATSLDWQSDISGARGTLNEAAGTTGLNRNAGAYAGANTQIINFNQTNNSPKALDRLTLYRQTNNMLFNAKVRFADV